MSPTLPLLLAVLGWPAPTAPAVQEPATGSAEAADTAPTLAERLARAIDQPTVEQRAAAAVELADDDAVAVGDWLAAARTFGDFQPEPAGPGSAEVALHVLGEVEKTRVHWFVPGDYEAGTPAPLLVALHGAGGSGRQEIAHWSEIAERNGLLVLAPTEAGANRGYTFAERERRAVLAALRWFRRRFDVDENRIHLTGVSRGGHACWDLARLPTPWASVLPRLGGPAAAITDGRNNIRIAVNFSHLPLILLQGMRDDPKMLLNQELALERLTRVHADARRVEFPELGHGYELDAVDWDAHFRSTRRDPFAARLILASARDDEGELLWLRIDRLERSVKESFRPRVDPNDWNRWGHEEKLRFVQREADERTARVVAEYRGPGELHLDADGIARIVLRLPQEMLGEHGRVEAEWNGRTRRKRLEADAEVLLRHFVEHFDRRFIPVAEWSLR